MFDQLAASLLRLQDPAIPVFLRGLTQVVPYSASKIFHANLKERREYQDCLYAQSKIIHLIVSFIPLKSEVRMYSLYNFFPAD